MEESRLRHPEDQQKLEAFKERMQLPIVVSALNNVNAVEPTGVGDAFRAGFLAAMDWGLSHERAAQVGCTLAAYVVETVGTQEYTFTRDEFVARLGGTYGSDAATEVAKYLS